MKPHITPYILAGGQSRRMGQDKRWLEWNDRKLIDIAIDLAQEATGLSPILVGDTFEDSTYRGCKIIPDTAPQKGPLGGLVAALRDCQSEWLLALPVDMPRLGAVDLHALISPGNEFPGYKPAVPPLRDACNHSDAIVFSLDERISPLPMIVQVKTLPVWEKMLTQGELSLQTGLAQLIVQKMEYSHHKERLRNINTPNDLK
ncbi:MAG: molybdenum cofactor guanylyltransferase [bacterium]